ncbi:CAMK family protein kinase [Trichomonas vaginalis G3]|uniref:CAMK family protein kinase n=1 Tax=Trichomonas vaginalis (strain ATCC PRA-98 / G3) TaxID=412133 RepID=A2E786_TRIV3|nr:protein serine/threonine kinase protein [Trichomonas vaginalis G3]EAY11483.1 CAMK family protein kinase [Trichomonas vaginalis G3]KAI5526755.1 protein serine/threonine kinase protein [Trichomonas vaginalis G3]|eukprot:XP_001323706.1 CAMK family protein kinase [Trichomonas vaginalis G3]
MIEKGSIHNAYEFIKMIKCTNYYELWKAKNIHLSPTVLIKVVSKSSVETEHYGEEIKIHSQANYPFIAKFYQYFEEDDMSFIVMEYLSEENFEDYITNAKERDEEKIRIWFSQMILSLSFLDSNYQVCHGSLEAGNFSLSNSHNLKLFDFENCQYLDTSMRSLAKHCHPFYLSPEEIRNESNPFTTTVWRCGIILYRMLTGTFPFEDDSKSELFTNILSMKPIIPSQISNDAKNLLSRMLTKDPFERITLEDIQEHPFFVKLSVNIPPSTETHIKSDILKQLEEAGYNKAAVIADLKSKLFTEKSAAYNILLTEGTYGDDSETSVEGDNLPLYKSNSASAFQLITQPKNVNSLVNKMKLRPVVSGRGIPLVPQKKFRRASSCKTVNDFYSRN